MVGGWVVFFVLVWGCCRRVVELVLGCVMVFGLVEEMICVVF